MDENALRKIVNTAEISKDDLVLEIGPGLGSLTRYLADTAKRVITIEIDEKMLPALHETLSNYKNVEIIVDDILKLNPSNLFINLDSSIFDQKGSYKVVANIPYYITSAVIRHLLEAEVKPNRIVLTVQKEVGQRICGSPPKMSLLALSVQVFGVPKVAAKIPAGAFYPAPKVDSSVVDIVIYPDPLIPNSLLPTFFQLAKAGFNQKRKTLRNSISAGMNISKSEAEASLNTAGIDPQRRAQTLSIKEWKQLANSMTQRK